MKLYENFDFWSCIVDIKQDKLIDNFGVSVYDTNDTQFLLDNYADIIDYIQIPLYRRMLPASGRIVSDLFHMQD